MTVTSMQHAYGAARGLADALCAGARIVDMCGPPGPQASADILVDMAGLARTKDHNEHLALAARTLCDGGAYLLCVKNPATVGRHALEHGGPWSCVSHYLAVLKAAFAEVRPHVLIQNSFTPGLDAESPWLAFVCRLPRPVRPKVKASIVIPLHNRIEYTLAALAALERNTGPGAPHEVILVDNGSTDKTAMLRAEPGSGVLVCRNRDNLGFAKACNQGALLARGDVVVFLNNDTEVCPGWLDALAHELEAQPDTGVCGGRLLYPDGTVQHAGVAVGRDLVPVHAHRGLPGDDPKVMERREFPMVTGACMAVRRGEFLRLGMFDESFVNGHEDIDLCMRYGQAKKRVIYRPDCVVTHHESVSDGRMDKREENLARTMHKWREHLVQDDFTNAVRLADRQMPAKPLTFAIKIGVPDRNTANWGDTYFAEGLAKALFRAGHDCRIHTLDEWGKDDLDVDVVIHLAGLSEYHPKPWNVNLMWMISHPERHTPDIMARYDGVLVASEAYAARLSEQVDVPVAALLQATDPEHFKPGAAPEKLFGLLFVGNNASDSGGRDREAVKSLARMDLAVWGEGWENRLPPGVWRGRSIDWQDLPAAYAAARVVVNDHHPDMRELGFINNRTFDAAACGAVVLSDHVAGIEDILPVETADGPEVMRAKARALLQEKNATAAKGEALRELVLSGHTFDHRAASLQVFAGGLQDAFVRAQRARKSAYAFHETGPLVSVLMATRNRREFLPRAARSVLGQTYANVELVLVNDGGEDVGELIRDLDDPRVRLVDLPERRGKAHAINQGFAASRGDFIAHLDDDDAWYPFHLESLVMALTNIPGLRMAYSDAVRVEQVYNGQDYQEVRRKLIYHHQVDAHYLLENNYITGISVCHDRDLFTQAGGMDERLSVLIDWDLWRRMALLVHPYHVSRVTAEYYVRGGDATSGTGHITNLHEADRPRYMAHRALIINKPYAIPGDALLAQKLTACRKRSRADFLKARADWRASNGQFAKAEKTLALACAVNPGEAKAYRDAGDYFLEQGRPAEALAYQKMALRQDDALEIDYLGAALTLFTMNRKQDARELVEAIEERFRPGPEVRAMVDAFVEKFMGRSLEVGGSRSHSPKEATG